MDLPSLLRKARLIRHLSQAEVARRAGVSHSLISKYELEQKHPSPEVLARLCDVLGIRTPIRERDGMPVLYWRDES